MEKSWRIVLCLSKSGFSTVLIGTLTTQIVQKEKGEQSPISCFTKD